MQREKFGSRLGFILISAGCAIGLGNLTGWSHWEQNGTGINGLAWREIIS